MATADVEEDMKQCNKCYYYFPLDDLALHKSTCKSVESRFECPICFCDYPREIVDDHAFKCTGLNDTISFITEYSRKKYSRNSIKNLINALKLNDPQSKFTGRQILRTINEKSFNLNQWLPLDDDKSIDCQICADKVTFDDIFILSCNVEHKLCVNCLYQHALLKLKDSSELTCPFGECKQRIHINELRCLPFPKHTINKLIEQYDKQLLNGFMEKANGAIKCPSTNCEWRAFCDARDRVGIVCENCKTEFCSKCRGKNHYRVECDHVAKVTQEWMTWCNVGRDKYRATKVKDKKAIASYENEKLRNQKRNEELLRNFEQLKQDEEYKQHRCRKCPNCSRVVEKIEGCDLMICGQNYHGGDIQNGCGKKFNWNQALAYQPQISSQPKLERFVLDAPKIAQSAEHYPYKCDKCDKDIKGIRFECLNCKCVNYCEDCESEESLNHTRGHVFRLILQPV